MRENRGFDFGAWRDALTQFGNARLSTFDEIILCNYSWYGPIDSFVPTFEKMAAKTCDFWGLAWHGEIHGKFPAHLQSYFLVLRKRLFLSDDFSEYLKKLRDAKTHKAAVQQETEFTNYFESRGFKAESLVPAGKYEADSTIFEPVQLNTEDAFPLLKRKVFSSPYRTFYQCSRGTQARDSLALLDEKNPRLAAAVRQDLLKTVPESRIRHNLHSMAVLPDAGTPKPVRNPERVALIIYSYFEDLVDEDLSRAQTMPEDSAVFIVVVSEKMKSLWEARREALGNRHVEIRVQENRGRNEAAYWLTCRDVIENYELICVAHDKKSVHKKLKISRKAFSDHCWENLLKTTNYVENVIEFFDKNPSFGILFPPPPIFGDLKGIAGSKWFSGTQGELARSIYKNLKMTVPFDESPNAPWGTMFWLRGKAMSAFYRYPWSVQDFPEEPIATDSTILHALETMYSMFAQDSGYFSAWILPTSAAGLYLDNFYFQILREKTHYTSIATNDSNENGSGYEIFRELHARAILHLSYLYLKKKWYKLIGKK